MKVVIDGKTITLVDRDVKTAKRMLRHFLETSREEAEKQNATTFYYTLLVVMSVMSNDYIKSISPEIMTMILNAAAETENERKNQQLIDKAENI